MARHRHRQQGRDAICTASRIKVTSRMRHISKRLPARGTPSWSRRLQSVAADAEASLHGPLGEAGNRAQLERGIVMGLERGMLPRTG